MENLVDFDTLRRIKSLSSLSRLQLARISKYLIWRHYAPNSIIRPHWLKQELEGIVFKGKVEVATVYEGRRQVIGHIRGREPIKQDHWSGQPLPVELRAVEPTILCLLPTSYSSTASIATHSQSFFNYSQVKIGGIISGVNWITLGILSIMTILLFTLGIRYWQFPGKIMASNLVYGLASYHLAEKAPDKALSLLQVSLYLNPHLARAHNDIGYIYYQQKRPQEAQAAFRQATLVDPTLAVAQNNLGFSYLEEGQLDLAREAFRQTLTLNPESAVAWLNLGIVEQRAGQPEEAARAYRAALRLNRDLTTAKINLGLLHYQQGQFAEAQRYLEMALDTQPDLPRARAILGTIALLQKDPKRAWDELQRVTPELINDPQLHFSLALWYEENGLREKAVQEFNTVLVLHPHPKLADLTRSHLVVFSTELVNETQLY